VPEIIEIILKFLGARTPAINFINAIFLTHEIPYNIFTKSHVRPRCFPNERAGPG